MFDLIELICIFQTLAVLNPLKQTDHEIMQDTDLAGPLVFCLAFGGTLMLVCIYIIFNFHQHFYDLFCTYENN